MTISGKTKAKLLLFTGLLILTAVSRLRALPGAVEAVSGQLQAVSKVDTEKQYIALTFDLTWGEEVPPKILTALSQSKIKATFFVSGPYAQSHPSVLRRILSEGHELGNHAYRHVRLSAYDEPTVKAEIQKTHSIVKDITGLNMKLFRPPDSDYNDTVIKGALDMGYTTVTWSLDSLDWKKPGNDFIEKRVTRRAQKGDIILFHASDNAPDTPLAIPQIVKSLTQKGYTSVTVSELLSLESD
jgi:polysaccharide deacetylase family sporulation protein PdaB